MHDEEYNFEWYIDSGCSYNMIKRKPQMQEYLSLKDVVRVKYGNNVIKGYIMIMNEEFTIRKVAFIKGLQHNLISLSQLVIGMGLKVSFDDDGSVFKHKEYKNVLLK